MYAQNVREVQLKVARGGVGQSRRAEARPRLAARGTALALQLGGC